MTEIQDLHPSALWQHFSALNAVPRPSKHEARVIEHIQNFGRSLNLPGIYRMCPDIPDLVQTSSNLA